MADINSFLTNLKAAPSWNQRVAIIRKVPEQFGMAQQSTIYSAIAKKVYAPKLVPDFAYVYWPDDYKLATIEAAYKKAYELTSGFNDVDVAGLTNAILKEPSTLKVFRLLLGLLPQEFSATTLLVSKEIGLPEVSSGRIRGIESGTRPKDQLARCCAEVIARVMTGQLYPPLKGPTRRKVDKPDTIEGWKTIREYAERGVPLVVLLHQRHYGGSFGQLLNATSSLVGDTLEDPVERLFKASGILYVRTGSKNQEEIKSRFEVTVKPAPDFVVYTEKDTPRAMIECKKANDGGTARDKASRYATLRGEAIRLGGVPLFAVLGGLGWTRASDALGPVVRDTDGRVFTLSNLEEILTTEPFPALVKRK